VGVRRLGITAEVHTEEGIPSESILMAVEKYQADLLVLGVHGVHRGLDHLLLGSNTEKILLSSNCPTLTVGSQVLAGVDLQLHLNEIIYFSDFTPEATAAAPYALFYGKEFDAPVEVCLLLPVVAENNEHLKNELAEEYCKSMRQFLPGGDSDWCKPDFQLDRAMEIEQIIKRAQGERAGLIVLGVRAESQLGRHLHTSFAYHLLAKATCPVLTIRHQMPDSSREVF
jgi:nucleotide-binding universal stress UspA family protein